MGICHSTGRGNRFKDISGIRYGRLTAISVSGQTDRKKYIWHCQCECGQTVDVEVTNLTRGYVRSCGCLLREAYEQNLAIGRRSAVIEIADCPPLPVFETEEIRYCPNRIGYAVTDHARVFSCRKFRGESWSPLKIRDNRTGYPFVTVRADGAKRQVLVAKLVAEAFIGPCPSGMELCHNDGDKHNSLPCNLRWDTHQENINDSLRHGTHSSIQRHLNAKLSADDARAIRQLGENMKLRDIAGMYGVGIALISSVLRGTVHPEAGGKIRAKGSKWSKPDNFRRKEGVIVA